MRCHPDQFRQHSDAIRKQQSVLVQALGERMIQDDFKDYTANKTRKRNHYFIGTSHHQQQSRQSTIKYALEKRDGTLLHRTLDLNASVENILQDLASALESSGAAKIQPPPKERQTSQNTESQNQSIEFVQFKPGDESNIDNKYDVNSNRGRDLQRFLSSITPAEIEERKAFRMDAMAAAMVARRRFGFQSIDGVRLGYSSKAYAALLSSLIKVHEEYKEAFNIQSFYPLRLVFARDDKKESLDVYGGILYLHPSGTQLEWLNSVKEVTEAKLQEFAKNRQSTMERATLLQDGLGIDRVQMGFTCTSVEYYHFLKRNGEPYRIAESPSSEMKPTDKNELVPVPSSSSVSATSGLRIVVESPNSCRRAKVTKEGFIQVPSNITSADLISTVTRLSGLAAERREAEDKEKERCRKAIEAVQWEFGLQKVSRHDGRVTRKDFSNALLRLLEDKSRLEDSRLSGASLRVASSGQFCHLSDDGALVIPHDWK